MKNFKTTLFSVIGIITICTTPIFTDVSANETEEAQTVVAASDCNLPAEFVNFENMSNSMADPVKFMQFMTLLSKPEIMQTMMDCSTDTKQWSQWSNNLMNPSYKLNGAEIFMNPQVYMNWMTAMMNPQTYQAAMTIFMNPALYTQWMTAMSKPAYYQDMFKMMDPKWQQDATVWMMKPSSYTAALNITK